MRVLFVCTHNIARSRAAEEAFQVLAWSMPGRARHEARSAGTSPMPGGRAITRRDIEWADVICVMEPEHEGFIRERWPLHGSKLRLFAIPDVYQPNDPVLHDLLASHIRALLEEGAIKDGGASVPGGVRPPARGVGSKADSSRPPEPGRRP
jgi:protein-tyrosine-phosphatase